MADNVSEERILDAGISKRRRRRKSEKSLHDVVYLTNNHKGIHCVLR